MLALPELQSLYEKYKDNGFVVVGIDPYDKKEDNIDEFLSKRGVTYPVLLGDKECAKKYNVSGYPTIYILNRKGEIVYSEDGYSKGKDVKLEKIIKENL